ncbi:MAG: hypothetical protein R3B89_00300 [Polyangiaceae bacterium]
MKLPLPPKPARKHSWLTLGRAGIVGALAFGAGLFLLGCPGSYELDSDEPCRQAGFAIASRNQACSGDADRANALYERFVDEYACAVSKPTQADFRCAYNVNALDCQRVETLGDDLSGYLAARGCILILQRKDGEPMPLEGLGPDGLNPLTRSRRCADVLWRLAEFESACGDAERPIDLYVLIAADLEPDHRCDEGASEADLASCLRDLNGKRCVDFAIARDLLSATPSCQKLLPRLRAQGTSGAPQ